MTPIERMNKLMKGLSWDYDVQVLHNAMGNIAGVNPFIPL
jgi:hypothetical protein